MILVCKYTVAIDNITTNIYCTRKYMSNLDVTCINGI